MDVLVGDLKAVESSGFRKLDLCGKVAAKIFIDDAIRCRKKARTWDMKCCTIGESLFQSVVSAERSISSAVQKDASVFLYTSSRCRHVGWGRGRNDWGLLGVTVLGQDGRLSWRSCALTLCIVTVVSLWLLW